MDDKDIEQYMKDYMYGGVKYECGIKNYKGLAHKIFPPGCTPKGSMEKYTADFSYMFFFNGKIHSLCTNWELYILTKKESKRFYEFMLGYKRALNDAEISYKAIELVSIWTPISTTQHPLKGYWYPFV